MGRVCCWLRIGGGCLRHICNDNRAMPKYAILRHISATLLCSVYILSFLDINAPKTPKNGHLLCVLLRVSRHMLDGMPSERPKTHITYIIHTHKKHTHF